MAPASARAATTALRLARPDGAQQLERAESPEALKVLHQERLDEALDLAGAPDLQELPCLLDPPRQQQREPGERIRRDLDRSPLPGRTTITQQPSAGTPHAPSLRKASPATR